MFYITGKGIYAKISSFNRGREKFYFLSILSTSKSNMDNILSKQIFNYRNALLSFNIFSIAKRPSLINS